MKKLLYVIGIIGLILGALFVFIGAILKTFYIRHADLFLIVGMILEAITFVVFVLRWILSTLEK